MDTIKKRVIAFFVGLFIAIFLLEIGLRIAGSIHLKRATSDKRTLTSDRDNLYTILCLGDSFTFGVGVSQGKDYPSQLEDLLNSRVKGKSVVVINRGRGGQNTAELLNKLPSYIDTIKPDSIILLVGDANLWNYWGYQRYLKGKTLLPVLQNHLYRVRVYKLIKLLFLNVRSKIKDNLLAKRFRNKSGMNKSFKSSSLIHKDPHSVVTVDGWTYKDQGRYKAAIKWFKEAIKLNSDDSHNYSGLGWVYKEQENPRKQ